MAQRPPPHWIPGVSIDPEPPDPGTAKIDDPEALMAVLQVLRPKPSPRPLLRIGGTGDGAYLVPDDLDGIRACLSPGVADRKPFEDELLEHHGIASELCDHSTDPDRLRTPLVPGRQVLRRKWLDVDGGSDSITLADWVAEAAPDPADDLMLQMDIEGAEYRNLLATPEAVLRRFRIIVVELHGLDWIVKPQMLLAVMAPLTRLLDRAHTAVHFHPNNCCGDVRLPGTDIRIPRVAELTFLRKDRFAVGSGATLHPPQLPHPLDIPANVPGRPPLVACDFWRGGAAGPDIG